MCLSFSHIWLFVTPWTVNRQASLSMAFSRQEYCAVSSHSLLQGIFLTQGSNPGLLHCRQIRYRLSHLGSPTFVWWCWVLVVVCAIFSCGMQTFSCGMCDLVPRPRIEPGPLALGMQSLNHWTTSTCRV